MTSSARLQQDANVAREGLSAALDELRGSVTTTALTNGAMTFAKEGSSAIAKAAVDRALASPLAALLIGAGIVMLMSTDQTSPAGGIVDKGNAMVRDTGAAIGSAGKSVASAASSALSATTESAASVADTTANNYEKAKSLVSQGQEQGMAKLHDAQQMIAESRTKLEKFAAEQPILVAALGVAFGAALGAALPMTEAERGFMGDAGKKIGAKGTEVAKAVADTVTDKITGGDVTGKVNEVIGAAASTVTGSLAKS